jgi:acetolactate synthase-1/2/3 large subunit
MERPGVGDETMTGAQALVRYLELEGVEYVFGMCGHANLALLDALAESRIRFISVPHEQIAAHAADCYFRVTHKPGVVITTVGPGLGNAVNGIMDAAADCSSVVVISGNVPTQYIGKDAFQELHMHADASQAEIYRPFTKRTWRVDVPQTLMHTLARAFNYSLTGRPGPVLVDVPMDIFSAEADFDIPVGLQRRPTAGRPLGEPAAIARAVRLLREAERPIIFAGGGVILAEAESELVALAEYLGLPVITSMIAQGAIPNDHPLYFGFTGSVGTPTGNGLARTADVVLAVGTRFGEIDCNSWLPSHFFPVPNCRIVQVDIEPNEIGKLLPVDVGIVGDAKMVLGQMLDEARATGPAVDWRNSPRYRDLDAKRRAWQDEIRDAQASDNVPLELERVIRDVCDVMPENGILLTGVGPRHHVGQHYTVRRPRTHIVASGHGTMGLAVPGALGAKLGRPDAPVVALVGDGEFRSVSQTLAPAVEYHIPAVWVVLNNYGFNIITLYQQRHYGRSFGTEFSIQATGQPYNPDFVALAQAYGAEGRRIERPEELKSALAEAIAAQVPYVLDVPVTRQPHLRSSGYWDANRFIKLGWNVEVAKSRESPKGARIATL